MRRFAALIVLSMSAGCTGNVLTTADSGAGPGAGVGGTGSGGSTGNPGAGGGGPVIGIGGATGTAGAPGAAGARGTGGASGTTTGTGGAPGLGGAPGGGGAVACSTPLADRVRVTEVDVGVTYGYNEVDNNGAALGLTPLAISAVPGGGSRLAFLGRTDSMAHVVTLDAADQIVPGSAFALPAFDFQDLYADATGGVMLVSRNALGSTLNHNCGDINNLCGLVANYPTAASCYDMYMVRFDGGTETWATKVTDTTAALPGYSTAPNGAEVVFIWSEYAHNGRIAFDGTNYAGYFGVAITVAQPCVGDSTRTSGINIHQGDRMKAVSGTGALLATPGFGIGCSHSGYERIVWDPTARAFISVCKNDAPTGGKSGKIAFAPNANAILPIDLNYDQIGTVMLATGGGYWIFASDIRAGQPANANGLADIHLLRVASTAAPTPTLNLTTVSDGLNDRAPHLVQYGAGKMVAAWETSTATGDFAQNAAGRQMWLQVLDSATGMAPAASTVTTAGPLNVTPNVLGSRYQDFRAFPDGSVAYPAPGSTGTKIKVLRVLPCGG
jgi:hypothetical protein